jgi:Asp-tRNA(Asn)/Glu-tRNA(Gln) amidotransferase A subunit family amidase
MEMKAKRLEVTEALIADWRGHNIDVVIAPGFAMPAVKVGYAGWLLGAITYTSAYNLLNFPAGSVPVIKSSLDILNRLYLYVQIEQLTDRIRLVG